MRLSKMHSAIGRIRRRLLHFRLQPIHVYCFHHVSESFDGESMYPSDWMSSEAFKNALTDMLERKVKFISLTDARRHIRNDFFRFRHFAVITFDDGYASLKEILPWLEEQRIPVTLFINGQYLDGRSYRENPKERYLTYEELFQRSSEFIEIASHGWEHIDATLQDGAAFARDIGKNVGLLSQHRRYVPFHAYTWGRHNDSTDAVLKRMEIVPVLIDAERNYHDVSFIHRESYPNPVHDNEMQDIPVLLITFNRPEHVRRVLSVLQTERPKELFIFQDGPRDGVPADGVKCEQVRSVIKELVDWDCTLHTFFPESNYGCGPGPVAAISWFFRSVEMGIILEDDAIPHPDFFGYAGTLLTMYADDSSVMAVGSMKLGGKTYGDGSYYFSKMNHTLCAWATWRRAWERFDYSLRDFSEKQLNACLKGYGAGLREREYWCERLKEIHKDCLGNSSWDQQFWMSIWRYGGKGILPNRNLCSNIGFDSSATHTRDASSLAANVRTERILPLVHPSSGKIRKDADLDFQRRYFSPWSYGWRGLVNLPFRMNKRLKRLLNHEGPWLKKRSEAGE